MNTNTLIIAFIALILGTGGGYLIATSTRPTASGHTMGDGMMMHGATMGMNGAMDEMMQGLQGKTGDDFDRTFLTEMIMHHQGAVQMAEAALRDAKHTEIKDMANAIISAQTAEIKQMEDWQEDWYGE